jgi:hypothetical protein
MNLVRYPIPLNEILNRFQEAVYDNELKYRTADLLRAGVEGEADLNKALLKTTHMLRLANVDTSHFLKRIYITDIESGKTHFDWRMNKVVFYLTILNSESQNDIIFQWKAKILQII